MDPAPGVTLTSLEAPLFPFITKTYPVPLYKIVASALSVALFMESLSWVRVVLEVVLTVTADSVLAVKVSFAEEVVLHVPKSIVKDPAPTVDPELS